MRRIPLTSALILGATVLVPAAPAQAYGLNQQQQSSYSGPAFANSATYNSGVGMSSGMENHLGQTGGRDSNGNLLIVNGLMSTAGQVAQQEGMQQSSNGYAGVGGGVAQATAIGNNLNVQVSGQWNTVIVDSKQVNNGTQRATAALNGQLTF